jgi:hypothetical protein
VLVEDFRMMVMIFERNQLLLEVSDPGFAGVPSNSDNLDYSDFDLNVITVTSIELVKDD